MLVFREFAKKFFEEAKHDLELAKLMFEKKDFPMTTFFSQQCVEKCAKALVELKEKYVYNHGLRVFVILREAYADEWNEDLNFIAESVQKLAEFYTKTRYPTVFLGKVYSPRELINEEIAKDALERAEKVLRITERYLRDAGIIC